MASLESYKDIICALLSEYVSTPVSNGEIECYTIFDEKQGHYQVMNVGWDGHRRVYGCVLHVAI